MRITVWCTTQAVGFHNWPIAPASVAFLRTQHRHVFHIKVEVLEDNERDVEFTLLKHRVETILHDRYTYTNGGFQFRDHGCETIAKELIAGLLNASFDVMAVEVSEDGENGARIKCA